MGNLSSSIDPVQVDVIVQDHFFEQLPFDSEQRPDHSDHSDHPSASPIAEATWNSWFQQWLQLQELPPQATLPRSTTYELSLRLTNDAEIQALNAQYRQKDRPTDVLAFAALEGEYPIDVDETLYLGDIVISVETAQRQATQLGHSLQQELAWLAAHALLHLLGWDHPDENQLSRMLKQQEILLNAVGLSINYSQVEQMLQLEYQNDLSEEV
jgi:probable rRNA maturation factor